LANRSGISSQLSRHRRDLLFLKPRPAFGKAGLCGELDSLVSGVETGLIYDEVAMYFIENPDEPDNPYRDESSVMSYSAVLSEVEG